MLDSQTVDITPSPRILRVLGEIPFQPWQCFAELMDNSIDALLKQPDENDARKSVWVCWSKRDVPDSQCTIEVKDNATGMTLSQMQDSVRAGYSNNNPIGNLGLFGMGFNIATARLGSKTTIWSTTLDNDSWYGIEIDFDALTRGNVFQAPLRSRPKDPGDESGTIVEISGLKSEVAQSLHQEEKRIRQTLEDIYAPLLSESNIDLYVNGKILHPKKPCIWGKERFVLYKGKQVPAYHEIDVHLGSALFDMERNAYLSLEEQDEYSGVADGELPPNICHRDKHLHGWIGIQRYFDTNDYGIDFVRNGRKILIQDKSLFSYTQQVTGKSEIQYPVELGSTVGGRIIGELHVDYLLPTYQKNDFDRYDKTWFETMDAIRGNGPFLPRARKALGLDEIPDTPLGLLVNAYRRTEAGTKNLVVEKRTARDFLQEFNNGNPDYQGDSKWWAAAQEADRAKQQGNNPPANTGETPSDDVDSFFNNDLANSVVSPSSTPSAQKPKPAPTSEANFLRDQSRKIESYSKRYAINLVGHNDSITVDVYELKEGDIRKDGNEVPCAFFPYGIRAEFFYNPRHPLLQQYPITPMHYLMLYLAEYLKIKEDLNDIGIVYEALFDACLGDERIDAGALHEKSAALFDELKAPIKRLLEPVASDALECLHKNKREYEDAVALALQSKLPFGQIKPDSDTEYVLMDYIPNETVVRLVEAFPDYLFDGHLFKSSYMEIEFADQQVQMRLRESSQERVLSYLKDLSYLLSTPLESVSKNDLRRISLSLDSIYQDLVLDELSD